MSRSANPEQSRRNNENGKYFKTSDLTTLAAYRIPRWSLQRGAGKKSILLEHPYSPRGDENLNIRSRVAQSGITYSSWRQIARDLFHAELVNYSLRDIVLPDGFGVGPLYRPSPKLRGEALIEAVTMGVDVDSRDLVFRDLEGNVIPADRMKIYQADYFDSFGIRVNKEKLWEVDPAQQDVPVVLNGHSHTREAVSEFLVETNGSTTGPFGVATTVPVSVHGLHLTLLPGEYGLLHSHSVIHTPDDRYNWIKPNGNHSGLRMEFISPANKPFTPHDLPPFMFFTGHAA